MHERTRARQGRSSALEPARVQYYLRRVGSLGSLVVGRAVVRAARLFLGIAGGDI